MSNAAPVLFFKPEVNKDLDTFDMRSSKQTNEKEEGLFIVSEVLLIYCTSTDYSITTVLRLLLTIS